MALNNTEFKMSEAQSASKSKRESQLKSIGEPENQMCCSGFFSMLGFNVTRTNTKNKMGSKKSSKRGMDPVDVGDIEYQRLASKNKSVAFAHSEVEHSIEKNSLIGLGISGNQIMPTARNSKIRKSDEEPGRWKNKSLAPNNHYVQG